MCCSQWQSNERSPAEEFSRSLERIRSGIGWRSQVRLMTASNKVESVERIVNNIDSIVRDPRQQVEARRRGLCGEHQ